MTAAVHTPRVTAGMPLDLLVSKLERAGGGDLTKRQRAALRGLSLLLPHGSAAGTATTGQVGSVVGYSAKWMGQALCDLEDMGLIDYHRGGVLAGVPQPSVFRVAKDVLCELIRRSAGTLHQLLEVRRREVRARLAGRTYKGRRRYNRRSAHAEVSSYLYPFGEGTGAASGVAAPSQDPVASAESRSHYVALAQTLVQQARRQRVGVR